MIDRVPQVAAVVENHVGKFGRRGGRLKNGRKSWEDACWWMDYKHKPLNRKDLGEKKVVEVVACLHCTIHTKWSVCFQVPAAAEEYVGAKWEEVRPLNGSQEEVEALWDRLILSRAAVKKSKKDKKMQAAISIAAEATSKFHASASAVEPEKR
jgi:hypothetical protein